MHRHLSGLLAVFFVFSVSLALAADWPNWRGPDWSGVVSDTNWDPAKLTGAISPAWRVNVGSGYSGVTVAGTRAYTCGNDGTKDIVYCFDAATGAAVWQYGYPCLPGGGYKGPRATPVIDEGACYVVSLEGHVVCIDAAKGTKRWERNVTAEMKAQKPKWKHSASPRVFGDLIILNAGSAGMALNKKTGKTVWASEPGVCGYAVPAIFTHKGTTYAAIFGEKHLNIVEAATGKAVSTFEWVTAYDINAADPIVSGEEIFISSGYGRGCAMLQLAPGQMKQLWTNKAICNHFSSSLMIDGRIYGVSGNAGKKGALRCLDAATGKQLWSSEVGFGSLIAAGDKLIVLNERGELIVAEVSPDAYREVARCSTGLTGKCWTAPSLANGIIYCRNDKGDVLAIDVAK